MAASMMMARPAPPASCMRLRQSRTRCEARVTSTTDSPVVVKPLTASNTAWVKLRPTSRKGQAPIRQQTTQLRSTMEPPSVRLRARWARGASRRQVARPPRARPRPGRRKAGAWASSSGQTGSASSVASMKHPTRAQVMPV